MSLNAPQWAGSSEGRFRSAEKPTSDAKVGGAKVDVASKYIFRPQVVRCVDTPALQRNLVLALHCPAGTGATVYNGWIESFKVAFVAGSLSLGLADVVHLVPIELPGRGLRMKEPLLTGMDDLATEISSALEDYITSGCLGDPETSETYVGIMGHSLGGWIGFEVMRRLVAGCCGPRAGGGKVTPLCFVASGIRSPTLCGVDNDIDGISMHELGEEAFWRVMEQRYGANKDLEHPSVRRMVWPILKADFTVSETYRYDGGLLDLPLFVAGGRDDVRYEKGMLEAWAACQTCRSCQSSDWFQVEMFDGGHNYLLSKAESMEDHVAWVMGRLSDSFALVSESPGSEGTQEGAHKHIASAPNVDHDESDRDEGNVEDMRANRSDRASLMSEGVESSIFANPGTTQTVSDAVEMIDGMVSVASMPSMPSEEADLPAQGGDIKANRKESREPRCRICSVM